MHICGIWKNWYRWSSLQSRNRDTDVENKGMNTKRGKAGMAWIERRGLTYIHYLEGTMLKLNSSTLATWLKGPTHWKRPWWWERLMVRWEGDNKGWDGWMASLTGWMWVWVNSGSWWWTEKPGMLQFTGLQRVEHYWATELNWTRLILHIFYAGHLF